MSTYIIYTKLPDVRRQKYREILNSIALHSGAESLTHAQGDMPAEIVILKDGINLVAFFFPLIWLLYNHLWKYATYLLLFCIVFNAMVLNVTVGMICGLLVTTFVALYANAWLGEELCNQGFIIADVVVASSEQEAMIRGVDSVNNDNSMSEI